MAATIRAVSSSVGTGSSVTLTAPAGTQSTDTLFAFIQHPGNVHFPGGYGHWSQIGVAFGSTTLRAFQLVGQAPSAGPWTFTLDQTVPYALAVVGVYGSVAGETINPDASATSYPPSGSTATLPAVTPLTANDLVLGVVGWGSGTTFTPPAGLTEQIDARSGNTATDQSLWVASESLTGGAGSSVSPGAVTNDNPFGLAVAPYNAFTLAIKSAPPPVAWAGDFETGDLSQYDLVQAADSTRIQLLTDSPRSGTYYARFTCYDTDVYPVTPTDNPRAQLVKSNLFYPGQTRWISWSTRFAADFPVVPLQTPQLNAFFMFAELYGAPFNGSPSIGFCVRNGDRLILARNSQYNYDWIWEAPLVRSQWLDFALRVNLAQDETGWVELHFRGVPQKFKNGAYRMYMQTMMSDQTSGCGWYPTSYREVGMWPACTVDHDGHRVDTAIPSTLTNVVSVAPPVAAAGTGGTLKLNAAT